MSQEVGKEEELLLKLGDIIYIDDPTNEILNENEFIIDYIDSKKIKLLNIVNFERTQLNINPDGTIGEGTIKSIKIISRNPLEGYARQNNLLVGTWVNIYFGGDLPVVFTGEITNLEEDMIEIRTIDNDILYINFNYEGIPEDLPIETFEIRPQAKHSLIEKEQEELDVQELDVQIDDTLSKEEVEPEEKKELVKERLKRFIIEADQIQFGDVIQVEEYVTIDKDKYRYNIDVQANDLLEDMISTIPNSQRTNNVLNNIHIMITRFLQLREISSSFDENNNIKGVIRRSADDKPLVEYLSNFKNNLYWILFVVKNMKKIYTSEGEGTTNDFDDVIQINQNKELDEIYNLFKQYKSNVSIEGQNKYIELYKSLNNYMTPFEMVHTETTGTIFDSINGIIIEGNIQTNINAIVDNLEDLYSSVVANNDIKAKKYIIQRYNLGLDRLEATSLKGSKMIAHRVKLTNSDNITLKSLMTLPEPTLRFSQINLPGTNMLVRSNLNMYFLNYWLLLKQKTIYTPVSIDNLDFEFNYDENNFLEDIKNYMLNLTQYENELNLTNYDIYKEFLNIVIPKVRVLFNLIKKYIKGKLSMSDLITYLEPFMIYTNDLTYMNYNVMNSFIFEKIKEYNRKYVEYSRVFSVLKSYKTKSKYNNPLLNVLESNLDIYFKQRILGLYTSDDLNKLNSVSSSEVLKEIISKDFGNLFNNSITYTNLQLMYPTKLDDIFKSDKEKDKYSPDRDSDKCKDYIISKKYYSKDALEKDNEQIIYFDKEFDKTNYNMLDEKKRNALSSDELLIYLTEEIRRLKPSLNAEYEAETLINRQKKVIDGQYAILVNSKNTEAEPESIEYYIRDNDVWVFVPEIDPQWFIKDESILCNIQKDCITSEDSDKCETMELTKNMLVSNTLKKIMDQFDKSYNISKEELTNKIDKLLSYYEQNIEGLDKIYNEQFYKYNKQQYELGLLEVEEINERVISPYSKLRDLIIGQSDFVKKQNDIILFVDKFCRDSMPDVVNINDNNLENPWYLYCRKTDTKLLPLFRYILAKTFVTNINDYENVLNKLKKEIGKISDDGDSWVDVNSGEVICYIDYDVTEGFKDGFVNKTREILEEDHTIEEVKKKREKRLSPEGEIVSNIVTTLATNMGILNSVEVSKDFIVKVVTELMNDIRVIEKESAYKQREREAAKKGKKLPEYAYLYSFTLMFLTLGTYLICIQTSIPSIKTRKTFPGCVRSFSGFPFDGEGDDSSIEYLACIAFKLRNPTTIPWNVLMRLKEEKIAITIKSFITKYLLTYGDIEMRIREKNEYLQTNPDEDIPDEHQISNWNEFLPPLKRFHIRAGLLENITNDFREKLQKDLRRGNPRQLDSLLVIESKIISYSLMIQEEIQKIIDKKDLLLKSSTHPFMDNACCNDNLNMTTLEYFNNENSDILVNNSNINSLSNLLKDIRTLTESGIFLSIVNTKRKIPETILFGDDYEFSEETIYKAFIEFCHFQSSLALSEDLIPFCSEKPDYLSKLDTIQEKIIKLKRDGRNYTKEMFLRLFQIVCRNNIIKNLSFNIGIDSCSSPLLLKNVINKINETNDETIAGSLLESLDNLLENYELTFDKSSEEIKEMRKLKNYLERTNTTMRNELLDYLKKKSKIRKGEYNNINTFINELTKWKFDVFKQISDDGMYNYINYFKYFINMLVVVFPNMILNKQMIMIEPPNYWKLSNTHNNDIKRMVDKYYEPIKRFYDDNSVKNILYEIQNKCKNIVLLSDATPALTNIKIGSKELSHVFDKRLVTLLYEYYILQILNEYIDLTKSPEIVSRMLSREASEQASTDFLIETQLRFNETEEQMIRGDVSKLQENVAMLLVSYIKIMKSSKETINMSYQTIQDNIFKLKEAEKYTFTDRLKDLTEEERAVDTIMKANKLGVWSKGLSKSIKIYDPENYDQDKILAEKVVELQNKLRKRTDVNERNLDILMEDEINDMDNTDFIESEEYDMSHMVDDYDDGDYYGDERENYDDYN
jgi:hypothetical protein